MKKKRTIRDIEFYLDQTVFGLLGCGLGFIVSVGLGFDDKLDPRMILATSIIAIGVMRIHRWRFHATQRNNDEKNG